MKYTVSALLAIGLVSVSLSARGVDTYTIHSSHTYPSFRTPHLGISWWTAKFTNTTGKVTLDPANGTGTLDVVVDAASIDFGHGQLNEQVKKEEYFNVAQYPQITYKGNIRYEGTSPASIDGELTLIGKTLPVPMKINSFKCVVHPMYKRDICGADVEGVFNRRDFGMVSGARDEAAGVVKLLIQVEALKD